jgi:hypothetical protein
MADTVQKTTIVNIRTQKCDEYCGRPSTFGNPYEIGRDGTRNEVVEKFRDYFYKKLQDPTFRAKVLQLKGKRLGCWCSPRKCHLEIIVEYIENEYE